MTGMKCRLCKDNLRHVSLMIHTSGTLISQSISPLPMKFIFSNVRFSHLLRGLTLLIAGQLPRITRLQSATARRLLLFYLSAAVIYSLNLSSLYHTRSYLSSLPFLSRYLGHVMKIDLPVRELLHSFDLYVSKSFFFTNCLPKIIQ